MISAAPIRQPAASNLAPPILLERHYSVQELASAWNLGHNTVRRMFEEEPGVLHVGKSFRRGRRGYVTLRIPESVAQRVHERGAR
jgi:hypothetical protein